jgi:hypothetical protein
MKKRKKGPARFGVASTIKNRSVLFIVPLFAMIDGHSSDKGMAYGSFI